jgi:hypothetical protein
MAMLEFPSIRSPRLMSFTQFASGAHARSQAIRCGNTCRCAAFYLHRGVELQQHAWVVFVPNDYKLWARVKQTTAPPFLRTPQAR